MNKIDGAWRRLVLEFRTNGAILNFLCFQPAALMATAWRRPTTPSAPKTAADPDGPGSASSTIFGGETARAAEPSSRTISLFQAQQRPRRRRQAGARPAAPGVLVHGLGLFGMGRTKREAAIAADIAEEWITAPPTPTARPLPVVVRSRPVRLRILVLGTGEARHHRWSLPRRPDRGDHRRRGRDRCRGPKLLEEDGAEVALLDLAVDAAATQQSYRP